MSQPARATPPAKPDPGQGPQAALPSVEQRIERIFGDLHSLAVMQGTILQLARTFATRFGLDYDDIAIQSTANELAGLRREEAICEHAVQRAIAENFSEAALLRGQGENTAYALAFIQALQSGALDLIRARLKEIRGQAKRAEDSLLASARLFTAQKEAAAINQRWQTETRHPQAAPARLPSGVALAQAGSPQTPRAASPQSHSPSRASSPARPQGS